MSDQVTQGIEQVKVIILPDGRIDRENAAKALGFSPKTLAQWQWKGIGPRARRVGGRVFYDWADIQAFQRGEAA